MKFGLVLYILVLLAALALLPLGIAPNIVGNNYNNVSVWTQVNISNSFPEVLGVTIYDTSNSSVYNITVAAGGYKSVTCNASVRDWNGFGDIKSVNATLYYYTVNSSSLNDNNTHYTNSSCTLNASTGLYIGWYACTFQVLYYANNGTWYCNVTDIDSYNTTGNLANSTTFYPVYALNISDGINYGNMATGAYSNNVTANITNFGNMPINITVLGYGAKLGDGLAMNCSLGGNITVGNERFSTSLVNWVSKLALTTTSQMLSNLTMQKQINSSLVLNSTYWQLYTDPTNIPGGVCTGYVLFSAQTP